MCERKAAQTEVGCTREQSWGYRKREMEIEDGCRDKRVQAAVGSRMWVTRSGDGRGRTQIVEAVTCWALE